LCGVEWRLSQEDCSKHDGHENSEVASDLELQESLDVGVNIASPHDSAQD
jgi:hypothetical protein